MQTPVVNGWLFYSVLNHANYNATGGGLEFIYKPIIPSHKLVKYTCIYCCHSSRPTELARTEQSCEKKYRLDDLFAVISPFLLLASSRIF